MNVEQAHKLTIGASQVHRIMTNLEQRTLPSGARQFIADMARLDDGEFKQRYESASMAWGIEQEPNAIKALENLFECQIEKTGEQQERIYAGSDYQDFISALPDGIMMLGDDVITVEVKCLDTHNHIDAENSIIDGIQLFNHDYAKFCQVQTQNLCAESEYAKPVQSIIAFYDPRHSDVPHYAEIHTDYEWREKLKERVMLARQLYDQIKNEDPTAPVLIDGDLPPTKLVVARRELIPATTEISDYIKNPQLFLNEVMNHFNVELVAGHFVGGEVFDASTDKGRQACKKVRTALTKTRTGFVKVAGEHVEELKKEVKQELEARKKVIEGVNALSDHLCKPLNDWEAEQERIEKETIEAEERRKAEIIERENQRTETIRRKISTLTVSIDDVSSRASVNEKMAFLQGFAIDEMFQEFQDEAIKAKADSIECLNRAIADFDAVEKATAERIEQQAKTARKIKLDALKRVPENSAGMSVDGLKEKLGKVEEIQIDESEWLELYQEGLDAKEQVIKDFLERLIPEAHAAELKRAEEQAKRLHEEQQRKEEAERQRSQAEEDKRKANEEHRQSIHDDVINDMSQFIKIPFTLEDVFAAISKGKIRHVSIKY